MTIRLEKKIDAILKTWPWILNDTPLLNCSPSLSFTHWTQKTVTELLACSKHFRDTKKNKTKSSRPVKSQQHSLLGQHVSSFPSFNPHIPYKRDHFLPLHQVDSPASWTPCSGSTQMEKAGYTGCYQLAFSKHSSNRDIKLWLTS